MKQKLLRLDRILSSRGCGTRTAVKKLVSSGQVKLADGTVLKSSAEKHSENVELWVNGQLCVDVPVLAAWYKPTGILSTLSDPLNRLGILEALSSPWKGFVEAKSLHPVGRLDQDTSGLLLFSKDGDLTNMILDPNRHVKRQYRAKVNMEGKVYSAELEKELRGKLRKGVLLSDGPCTGELVSFTDDVVEIVVDEGRHRVVRRVLNNAGFPVLELHRQRFGPIVLEELGLKEGELCPISEEVVEKLMKEMSSPEVSQRRKELIEFRKEMKRTNKMFGEIFDD